MAIVTGRIENREKTEQKIMRFIADKPQYIKDYYRRGLMMSGGSHTTHYVYVCSACRYIAYLKEKGVDISDVNNFTYRVTSEYLADVNQAEVIDNNGVSFVKRSNSHFNTTWSSLNRFFKFLIADGQLKCNPLEKIPRSKGKDHPNRVCLDQDQIRSIIQKLTSEIALTDAWSAYRNLALIVVLLQTGIRVTALTEINIDNINYLFENGVVSGATITIIDKEDKEFNRFLSAEAARIVYNWSEKRKIVLKNNGDLKESALFIGGNFNRISSRTVERIITKYSPIINGKKISPHKYRATYGTTLYKATRDIYYVQKQMGHASPVTTSIYVIDNEEDEMKATNIMDKMIYG